MDERIKNNMIVEMLNDDELLCGGIFSKEKYYMEKYNISDHEMGMIECMIYFIKRIQEVKEINVTWK